METTGFSAEKPYPDPMQTVSPTHPLSNRMKHSQTENQEQNHYWTQNPAQPTTIGIVKQTPTNHWKDYRPKGNLSFSQENGQPQDDEADNLRIYPPFQRKKTTNHFQPTLEWRKPSTNKSIPKNPGGRICL
jgi:hypothetical protein